MNPKDDKEFKNIFQFLVIALIAYILISFTGEEPHWIGGIMGILSFILTNLVGFVIAFIVFYYMRARSTVIYREGYYKGQEDYSKLIPEREAHLEQLNNEWLDTYSKYSSFSEFKNETYIRNKRIAQYAYEQGLRDGYYAPYEFEGIDAPDDDTLEKIYKNCHLDYARAVLREKREQEANKR